MKKIILFPLLFLFFDHSYACLNEYHVTHEGHGSMDAFTMNNIRFYKDFDTIQLKKQITYLRLIEKRSNDSLSIENDIAVKLIKLGKLNEASVILEGLYKKYPQEYNVVINLGTLYELMGKNELALSFIKKAIAINPLSHEGSEWFHVKVLENKINNYREDYLMTNKLLQLNSLPLKNTEVTRNVAYQLQERIPFTPIPNLAMANMLNEFGDYLSDSLSISGAYVIYNMALEYYPSNDVFHIKPKLDELKILIKKYKVRLPEYKNYFRSMADYYKRSKEDKYYDRLIKEELKKQATITN